MLRASLLVVWALSVAAPGLAQGPSVLVARVDGPITPVVAEHLADGVAAAERQGHTAFVVEIDTPGGLDVSMREIVQTFLNSPVPVIAYVSPSGARAASAGTFITMAAHVAAMAPGTTIGAATPVDLQGGEITEKIINDAVSFAVSVAEVRGRSVEFAEEAVREGRSVTASQAEEEGVVDFVATDLPSVLEAADGTAIELADGREVTLVTAGASLERYEMTWSLRVLERLADPNLAFLFLSLGTLALIYEVANPGMGLGGILGLILLILAFFSLSVLPTNLAGVALLLLAGALFLAELFVPGVGVFAAGGTIALVVGGLFLFQGTVTVSPSVLWPVAGVVGLGVAVAGRLAWRARRAPSVTGPEAAVGREVTVQSAEGATGQAFFEGAWWRVRSRGEEPLDAGQKVVVVDMDGLELIVEPKEGGGP